MQEVEKAHSEKCVSLPEDPASFLFVAKALRAFLEQEKKETRSSGNEEYFSGLCDKTAVGLALSSEPLKAWRGTLLTRTTGESM